MSYQLLQGDCRAVLAAMDAESLDACVTDPPYELGFMAKSWDSSGVAFDSETWRAVLRVLKPGAYLVAFGGSRTFHRIAVAIEDAGFEIRDSIAWIHGQGFPKNLNVALAIDKHLGVESAQGPSEPQNGAKFKAIAEDIDNGGFNDPNRADFARKAATSPEAQAWDGWGTALSPAFEPVIVARKPFKATVAAQVLETGTGAMNIDACRTGQRDQTVIRGGNQNRGVYGAFAHDDKIETFTYTQGRWPKNVVLEHLPGCEPKGSRRVRSSGDVSGLEPSRAGTIGGEQVFGHQRQPRKAPGDGDGYETIDAWACAPGCPVAELDRQSGESNGSKPIDRQSGNTRLTGPTYSGGKNYTQDTSPGYEDNGGASRFFPTFHPFIYQAKPSRAEKDAGLESLLPATGGEATGRQDGSAGLNNPRAGAGRTGGARNTHPTVKGIALMSWLVRLVTPPGGTLIDPFCGSGSTLVAALREGFDCIGIDLDPEGHHLPIARARCEHAREIEPWELPLFADLAPAPEQTSLFDAPVAGPQGDRG